MMADRKHIQKNRIATSEAATGQSKVRTFMRQKVKEPAKRAWKRTKEFGSLILKHPKTALAATAITVMLLAPVKTSAQDISGKTELVSDKEPTDKYRETKLKDGYITFEGVGTFDVRDAMKLITKNEKISEGQQYDKKDVMLEGVGKGVYYIFENGIVGFFVNKDAKTIDLRAAATKEDDPLFLNSIFVADNGAIFATSSKTFIALTAKDSYPINYPDILKLESAVFNAASDKDKIELRDPNTLGKERMKILFSFTTGKIKFLDDDAPIGGADQ